MAMAMAMVAVASVATSVSLDCAGIAETHPTCAQLVGSGEGRGRDGERRGEPLRESLEEGGALTMIHWVAL